jgi:ATP-dependent exoDNAse (exonuclease V) alpha subunit
VVATKDSDGRKPAKTSKLPRLGLDDGRRVELNPKREKENPHFEHGYAVTSHSAQGLTADRVLINVDTDASYGLVNSRFAYVAVSRAKNDVQI